MNRIAKYESPFSALIKDVFQGSWDPWGMAHYNHTQETISNDEKGYTIKLILPGVPKEKLSVEIKNNILYVQRDEKQLRSYRVPEDTDSDAITAELANGVLELKVPLKKYPAIKIPIK